MAALLPLGLIAALQALLLIPLLRKFGRVLDQRRIPVSHAIAPFSMSIIVPVLNEEDRLPAMLGSLLAETKDVPEIVEILVVDGGSSDHTQAIVASFMALERRLAFVDVSPVPVDAVGKAWGLMQGAARARGDWLLTLDADTIVAPGLARSLASFAFLEHLDALSVATRQACPGWLQSMLHPAFLTTLVYRFGPPGFATDDPRRVMANGQCFFASKSALAASQALPAALASLCEDITIARTLASAGHAVGFFETDLPVEVQMYASAREVWANWPRSLVMRDQYADRRTAVPFAQILLLQAAPLPFLVGSLLMGFPAWFAMMQAMLLLFRLGVLFGVRGAYAVSSPTYWLSPLMDVPVSLRLVHAQFQRRLVWRGRVYARGRDGAIRAVEE
jgi:dolichol-phosphate mannosyltransferase